MTSKHYDELVKFVFIGDSSVGKTSMLLRFAEQRFPEDHMPTIGIDFKIKIVMLNGRKIKMQLWDTAGQERFQTIASNYYKGAAGVILVYDCGAKITFLSVQNWLKQINEHAEEGIVKVLVANKSDLASPEVTNDEGLALAKKFGMQFYSTSAKTGAGVEELFNQQT